jgi:ubiquinone/menaquinone biosynthesis C-methylase UbiE
MGAPIFNNELNKLEDPEQLPGASMEQILKCFGLGPGMIVANVGAGSGFFTIPIARAIQPGGTVWAINVQPELLTFLGHKLEQVPNPHNIELRQGDAAHTHLHSHTCDRVIFVNVWHEVHDRAAALQEARRVLKAGGRIGILDWRPDASATPGPPLQERVPLENVVAELEASGWRVLCSGPLEPYSYFAAAEAPPIYG